MPNVFDFTDYRVFLKSFHEERKRANPHFSYRYLSARVGFKSAGHFTQIIQGRTNISSELTLRFISFLKLKKREAEYFELMVSYTHARTHEDKKHYFERMLKFSNITIKAIDRGQHEFCRKWYYSAIRELLTLYPFTGDYAALGRRLEPEISAAEARSAVDLLLRLGMISRHADGRTVQVDPLISAQAGDRSVALCDYALQALELAKGALLHIPHEQRSISGVTFSVSEKSHALILDEIRAFRKRIMQIVNGEHEPDRVYSFSVQLIPISKPMNATTRRSREVTG